MKDTESTNEADLFQKICDEFITIRTVKKGDTLNNVR